MEAQVRRHTAHFIKQMSLPCPKINLSAYLPKKILCSINERDNYVSSEKAIKLYCFKDLYSTEQSGALQGPDTVTI